MHLSIIIGFVIAMALQTPQAVARFAPANWLTPLVAGLYIGGAALLARAGTLSTVRALARARRDRSAGEKRWHMLLLAERIWMLVGLAVVMVSGYADWISAHLGLQELQLVSLWMGVLPFLLALVATWLIGYRAHRAIRKRLSHRLPAGQPPLIIWTRRQYVQFQLRTHLLFIAVPISLIIGAQDVLWAVAGRVASESVREWIIPGGTVLAAGTIFLLAPALITQIWRTRPLGETPLRSQLERLSRQLRLRYRRILVWDSDGVLANAAVMGLVPRVRYVLLSDALLDRLDRQQTLAVFAHEAGHVISHHLFYMALLVVSTALWAGALAEAVFMIVDVSDWAAEMMTLMVWAPLWVMGFGWMSRRFERQSDVVAAWALSPEPTDDAIAPTPTDGTISPRGAAIVAGALERVAQLNGTSVHQSNWRHGSIARRVQYLLSLGATGRTRKDIDRVVRRIKLGLWLALASAVAFLVVLTIITERSS